MKRLAIAPKFVKAKITDPGEADGGLCTGYASVFGNEDLGGDVIERGAFKKTIKERIPTGYVKFMDSHRMYAGTQAVIGKIVDAHEDDHGLHFTAHFSKTALAQEIRVKMSEGSIDALSFGFEIKKSEGGDLDKTGKRSKRIIKEVQLWEISAVVWGMNPKAMIDGVKHAINPNDDEYAILGDPSDVSETEVKEAIQDPEPEPEAPVNSERLLKLHSLAAVTLEAKRAERLRQLHQMIRG